MKIAIYTRVSTSDKGQTTEQQESILIDYCKNNNLEFEIFKDFVSGSKESRPQLDLMLQRIRSNEFKGVLVLRLDRLGRSLKHLLQLIEEFKNKKIKFICLSPQIDTETSQGMFFLQIMGAVSEFERSLIRERIKDKLNYLKANGVKLGRPVGSKDKGRRRTSGYNLRWQNCKK